MKNLKFLLMAMFSLLMPQLGEGAGNGTTENNTAGGGIADVKPETKTEEISHTITENDLKENLELTEAGLSAGEEVEIPVSNGIPAQENDGEVD